MIRVGVEVSDDMDGQKVVESGITVGGRDLSVIFFYSLVLVIFIIASIELFVLIHLEVYFWMYCELYIVDILLLYNS